MNDLGQTLEIEEFDNVEWKGIRMTMLLSDEEVEEVERRSRGATLPR